MNSKRREIKDVIGDLISSWQLPMEIFSVTDNLDGTYTLGVCKTYYLQPSDNKVFMLNGNSYYIIDVVDDHSVTIRGTVLPISGTFNLPVPFYVNGTLIQTNLELSSETDISNKVPMIYLKRPFPETLDADDHDSTFVATTADLTLYFLTEANFAEWMTADHDKYAIVPMRNMMYEFIELLKRNKKIIKRLTNYTVTDMIKFGLLTQKGYESGSLFSDKYSGVQLEITVGFNYICDDNC